MRILLCSHWFAPSFGGVETVSEILATEFCRAGAKVTIATNTPGPNCSLQYSIVRQPSQSALRKLAARSDIAFQNMISLRTLAPLALSGSPIVVTHHSWMRRSDGKRGLENYLKMFGTRLCQNISITKAIADSLPVGSTIIPNPFEASEFCRPEDVRRDKDIVFLGRLVSDKGCDLLLRSLGQLKSLGMAPSVSIIGDGPEMPKLKTLTRELDLVAQVEFLGAIRQGRGAVVSRHKIMVIPSIWEEPFGIVALEGISAGCALVASSGGGLPEAVGPCGLLFPNGNVEELTSALQNLLQDYDYRKRLLEGAEQHLKQFAPSVVAARYLKLFSTLVRK